MGFACKDRDPSDTSPKTTQPPTQAPGYCPAGFQEVGKWGKRRVGRQVKMFWLGWVLKADYKPGTFKLAFRFLPVVYLFEIISQYLTMIHYYLFAKVSTVYLLLV